MFIYVGEGETAVVLFLPPFVLLVLGNNPKKLLNPKFLILGLLGDLIGATKVKVRNINIKFLLTFGIIILQPFASPLLNQHRYFFTIILNFYNNVNFHSMKVI